MPGRIVLSVENPAWLNILRTTVPGHMNISLFIATRYLRARRSLQFISVITMLSLIGIVVGVAAIICVSSIFNGFREVYTSSMLTYDPHVRVEAERGRFLPDAEIVMASIRRDPRVKGSAGVMAGRVILRRYDRFHVLQLHGIEHAEYDRVSGIRSSVIVGRFPDSAVAGSLSGTMEPIVIGAELAMNAQLNVGDTATILSPDFIASALQTFMAPQGMPVIVSGIFYTNSKEYNTGLAFCGTSFARKLFNAQDDALTSADIRLKNDADADAVARDLRRSLPANVTVSTWFDLHKDIYGVMRYERYASFIILFIIVFISVFNIFAMLSMTVVKKRRDIGVLMAMGATPEDIRRVFLWEGFVVGLLGTLGGTVLGIVLCILQQKFEIFRFDPQTFIIAAIPVSIAWPEVLSVMTLTLISSFAATLIPARRAADAHVASSLRTE